MSKQQTIVLIPIEQARALEQAGDYALDTYIEEILAPYSSDGDDPRYDYYQIGLEEEDLSLSSPDVWPAIRPPDDDIAFEALITPDGVWHEIDWAQDDAWDVWNAQARILLASYAGCMAFTVYMHV